MKCGVGADGKHSVRGVRAETQAGPELQRLRIDTQVVLEVP